MMNNEQGSMINDRWSIKMNDEQWAIKNETRINDQWSMNNDDEQWTKIND
jgi:hypothetical protein